MAESQFVNQLVDGYVETGLADSPEDGALTRTDGTGRVDFEVADDRKSLEVFIGGDFVDSVDYDSETFAEDLASLVQEELGF